MIKANELRIGNVVYGVSDRVETIVEIHLKCGLHTQVGALTKSDIRTNCEDVSPIHLTPDWLQKFDFEKIEYRDKWQKDGCQIKEGDDDNEYFLFDGLNIFGVSIKYVHMLQNAWYFTTGKELKFQK